jgi:hypothetical protein
MLCTKEVLLREKHMALASIVLWEQGKKTCRCLRLIFGNQQKAIRGVVECRGNKFELYRFLNEGPHYSHCGRAFKDERTEQM